MNETGSYRNVSHEKEVEHVMDRKGNVTRKSSRKHKHYNLFFYDKDSFLRMCDEKMGCLVTPGMVTWVM